MFTAVTGFWRIWLISLLALWAVLLFGGFIFGESDPVRRMPQWTRLASSFVLVVAGWSWFAVSGGSEAASFALWLALGMTLGFVGDVALAGVLPMGRSVLAGMAAFGLGHVCYIVGMVTFAGKAGLDTRWSALAVWWLIAAVGWYFIVWRGQTTSILHQAALPYALLLAGTAGLASSLALQSSLFVPLAMGGALFLLSDLILAAELFNGLTFFLIGDFIWLTYGPAQMLIVYAVSAARKILEIG